MRIVINAIGAEMGGAARHLTNFLPALDEAAQSNDVVVLMRSHLASGLVFRNLRIVTVSALNQNPIFRLFHDIAVLPFRARRADIIVSLANFGPIWTGVPHVLFQRNALYFCPSALRVQTRKRRAVLAARRHLTSALIRRAATIVTPSHSMARLLLASHPTLDAKKMRVLYHAIDPPAAASLPVTIAAQMSSAIGLRIFYPTHAAPHKGFVELLQVLARARDKGLAFTFFSTVDRTDDPPEFERYLKVIRSLDLDNNVRLLGRVKQDVMMSIYPSMDLMIFPSSCESFGFPLAEAMASGLPILARDLPICREICGDAAVYFDPDDVEASVNALELLADPLERSRRSASSRNRAAVFLRSWRQYANEFMSILKETHAA